MLSCRLVRCCLSFCEVASRCPTHVPGAPEQSLPTIFLTGYCCGIKILIQVLHCDQPTQAHVNHLLDHRRLAKLTESPFIKVEATKYTELGYVGHDVEDIVKDLLEAGIALARQRMRSQLAAEARQRTEDRILRALLGQHSGETELQVGWCMGPWSGSMGHAGLDAVQAWHWPCIWPAKLCALVCGLPGMHCLRARPASARLAQACQNHSGTLLPCWDNVI